MKSITLCSLGALVLGMMAGCGSSQPPRELLDAREAYMRAKSGPATEFNPAQLHVAKESLDRAEKAFQDDGESQETKDLSYVAQRKSQLAEAQAGVARANRDKAVAQKDLQSAQGQMAQQTQGELAKTREQLAMERQARMDAERKAKEAMDNLNRIASVKEESRGTVITLSGSVLFASGKATLLPAAQTKLSEVGEALKQTDHTIVVEGHTDSQGSESMNQDLSTRRAQAVRDYLISRGIPSDKTRAVGLGSTRPVADNKTAEGRANNRRVEIVVEPSKEPQ